MTVVLSMGSLYPKTSIHQTCSISHIQIEEVYLQGALQIEKPQDTFGLGATVTAHPRDLMTLHEIVGILDLEILENLHAFQVDGMKVLNNIFIIATTNRKELIDEALLREGRIELHVKVEYPNEQGRLQILDINTRNMRQAFLLDEDVNLQEIACRTDGCSGFALASLVTRAHSYVVVQAGDKGLGKHVEKDIKVTMNHFVRAIEEVKSRLQESSLEPSR
ncbi:Vesicle-fusing ATPase [Camellia lanceoleosa]|uniref:Vesicle-fusing ATPase n=1 Tax=Camellia lanceoleosa TaxID=1840588 RepID=A0ACC0HJ01_9ERIC|nr:Vesicle-fusing ATPase [Camellia lanceoleosa]